MISRRSMLLYSMVLAAVSSRLDPASAQSAAEGGKIYAAYCSTCHGEAGKGNGIAARSLPVKPGDHTDGAIMNRLSDKFLVEIISKGGRQ